MSYTHKNLPKSQVEFEITLKPAEFQKDLEEAAVRISERAAIKGFRPGKAPYDMVKQQIGEIKIMEEAIDVIVRKSFFEAVKKENLETVGQPQISIEKMAPGNDLVYKAVVALLPKVTTADLAKIKVERKEKEVKEEDVEKVIKDLQKMRRKEAPKDGKATKDDKIVVDMDMFIDKVPLEGGQARDYGVYLNEPHYVPGMTEQLIDLKKDDVKEFPLKFPAEHYQKHLAGKNVDIKIKVKDVLELQPPALDDDFAKALGQKDMDKLKELLKINLQNEAKQKEDQRVEIQILDQLIEKSEFTELPDSLIENEKHRMFDELKHDLEHRGANFEQYLADLKKTEKEISDSFQENAIKRVKAALISRQIAKDNDIKVEKEDLNKEIDLIKHSYPDDKNVEENLKHAEVIDAIATTVQNRKVMEFLKTKLS